MLKIFTYLTNIMYGYSIYALAGSFIWGVLSIVSSPCHLASIPLIVGFIEGQGKISTKRAFLISLFFSVGILITIGVIGIVTGLLGRVLGDIGKTLTYIIAIIFIIIGLHLLDVIPLPFVGWSGKTNIKKRGVIAAFVIGLLFGVAVGPCTFAYMAPMLGVVFSVASKNFLYSFLLVLTYAIGHCSVIVFAGTFTEIVQRYLNWNEKSKAAMIVKKVCGIFVILGGIYLIFQ